MNSVFQYKGNPISFRDESGKLFVNATEMAKQFGTTTEHWLRTEQSQRLIRAISVTQKWVTVDLVQVIQGGDPEKQGTWMYEDIALVFAQWLSPDFYIWCNSRIKELLKYGITATDNKIEELIANPDNAIKVFTALKEEREKNKLLESKTNEQAKSIAEAAPKVLFADAVATSNTSILIGELAKILKQNGIEIGQNRLFDWLRKNGYLCNRKGEMYNMPTQYAMDLGLLEIKKSVIEQPNGTIIMIRTPKVSPKGQIYYVNKFLNDQVI